MVTWNNVGYFNQKSDLLNSFQVVLIWNGEEAYSQYLYPQGGINWVQAETGDSGLPDVRAQAGFVSEDGRFYQLRGSGSENVRPLFAKRLINSPVLIGDLSGNRLILGSLPDRLLQHWSPWKVVVPRWTLGL